MSWQATAWVSSVEAGGASGKLLLYALANYADEHGRCYPGDERIMRDTELSERAVRDWKRKLVDAGLIRIERRRKPGGDFDLDVIVLSMDEPPANSAGGTTGKSCRHHRQMVPSPPANGAVPPTPPYKAEPSKEPSEEPERESAGARDEDPKKVERLFERAWRDWPVGSAGSRPEALRVWLSLSAAERQAARAGVPRWLSAYKAAGRGLYPAFSRYLADKRWEELPEQEPEAPKPIHAPPFGPDWSVKRMALLLAGATMPPSGLTPFERALVERGDADPGELMRAKAAKVGFPQVNGMHDQAMSRRGCTVEPAYQGFGALMEAVPVGSETFEAWRREHDRRGWPWVPDPGDQPVVFFPRGGPDGLAVFEAAMREQSAEAAE